jgi:hypothetical protein
MATAPKGGKHPGDVTGKLLRSTSRLLKKSADWQRLSPGRCTRSEMMAIADVGLDDPAAAVELAVRRCAHADAANSFGSRVRL